MFILFNQLFVFILFNQIFMYVYLVQSDICVYLVHSDIKKNFLIFCNKINIHKYLIDQDKHTFICNSYHLNTEPQSDVALLHKVKYKFFFCALIIIHILIMLILFSFLFHVNNSKLGQIFFIVVSCLKHTHLVSQKGHQGRGF